MKKNEIVLLSLFSVVGRTLALTPEEMSWLFFFCFSPNFSSQHLFRLRRTTLSLNDDSVFLAQVRVNLLNILFYFVRNEELG